MTRGNHNHAADILKNLGLLNRIGSIDPAEEQSFIQVMLILKKWLDAYKSAGDLRPLRVYITHEPKEKEINHERL